MFVSPNSSVELIAQAMEISNSRKVWLCNTHCCCCNLEVVGQNQGILRPKKDDVARCLLSICAFKKHRVFSFPEKAVIKPCKATIQSLFPVSKSLFLSYFLLSIWLWVCACFSGLSPLFLNMHLCILQEYLAEATCPQNFSMYLCFEW